MPALDAKRCSANEVQCCSRHAVAAPSSKNKRTLSQVGSCSGSTISGAFFLPFLAFGAILQLS